MFDWIKKHSEEIAWFVAGISVLVILVFMLCPPFTPWFCKGTFDAGQFSKYGSFIGGLVGPLLAFAAFLMVYKTWQTQKEALDEQKKEFEKQKELANAQFAEQKRTADIERFETTFFNMLNMQQQIVDDLCYSSEKKEIDNMVGPDSNATLKEIPIEIKGRNLFKYFYTEKIYNSKNNDFNILCYTNDKYENLWTVKYFDHYFRHLYHIIKFIDNAKFLEYKERYKYASILRANLSSYELIWLYYNGLSSYGNRKFKLLIERYALLKNIRKEKLISSFSNWTAININNDKGKIITWDDVIKNKVSYDAYAYTVNNIINENNINDYEFNLTERKDNENKYYIGAFYKDPDIADEDEKQEVQAKWDEAKKELKEFEDFLAKNSNTKNTSANA
jgi:hypothetical protein